MNWHLKCLKQYADFYGRAYWKVINNTNKNRICYFKAKGLHVTTYLTLFIVLFTTSCEQRDPQTEYEILRETIYSKPQEGIDAAQEYIDYFNNKKRARITEVSEMRQQYRKIQVFFANSYSSYPDFINQGREINQELSYSEYNGVRKMWEILYNKEQKRLIEEILNNITESTFDDFFKVQVRKLCEHELNIWDIESIERVSLSTPTLVNNGTAKKSYGEYRILLRGRTTRWPESARISIEGTIGPDESGYTNEVRTDYHFMEKPILRRL